MQDTIWMTCTFGPDFKILFKHLPDCQNKCMQIWGRISSWLSSSVRSLAASIPKCTDESYGRSRKQSQAQTAAQPPAFSTADSEGPGEVRWKRQRDKTQNLIKCMHRLQNSVYLTDTGILCSSVEYKQWMWKPAQRPWAGSSHAFSTHFSSLLWELGEQKCWVQMSKHIDTHRVQRLLPGCHYHLEEEA